MNNCIVVFEINYIRGNLYNLNKFQNLTLESFLCIQNCGLNGIY